MKAILLLLVIFFGGYLSAATMRLYNNTDYPVTATVYLKYRGYEPKKIDLKPRDHYYFDSSIDRIGSVIFTPHNPFSRSKDPVLYAHFAKNNHISSVEVDSNITTIEIQVAYDGEAHLEKRGIF
ncbi:MAG: hypothetical protein WC707_02605 [Candidatus Babeliaceae bacterium]|jgi:hypothetical protein